MTSLLSILFLSGSFLTFLNSSGTEITMNFNGIWESSVAGNPQMIRNLIPLSVIILIICILSFTAIFLFKKRKIQLKLTVSVILLAILFIGLMSFYAFWTTGKYQAKLVPGFKMFIPLLMLVFGILAYRGIRKDENLVKSYDRLR
jgi:CHASE2 domain-containing sensor protein